MSRGMRIRWPCGIRFRLTAGLLLLVALSGFLLNLLALGQLERNMEAGVTADAQTLQSNAQVYVRQYLMLTDRNNDEQSFRACAQEIAEELYGTGRTEVALYALDGTYLLSYGGERRVQEGEARRNAGEEAAFQSAINGRAAYSLQYGEGRKCAVRFYTPLVVVEEPIGIISYALDYSTQYRQFDLMARTLLSGTMVVVALVCSIVLLFLTHILNPVRRLSLLSTRVAAEIKEGHITLPAPRRRTPPRRRDEISELSGNYEAMLRTVSAQFERISQDRVRILQLLDSRQAFYNNVTHELKTPLTTIKGYAQLMEENSADEELLHTGLAHIQHESARLHQMVIQLLEMSDLDKDGGPEPMDVTEVLASVADAMSLKASRYQNVIRMRDGGPLFIAGKESRIRQLFINLIDNAIKYGMAEASIWVEAFPQGSRAVVRVINRGKGMTGEEIEHIFEPFYRTDKDRSRELGSAGLGLAICKKIVDEHGGAIAVDSRINQETVFTVAFPLLREDAALPTDLDPAGPQ